MGACVDLNAAGNSVFRHACGLCSLQEFCWPPELTGVDRDRLHRIIERTGKLPAGKHLFRGTDRSTAVYAVRTGCVKTYTMDSSGHEHVQGFHLPGELLGFDAVYPESHRTNALIVKDSAFCIVPYRDIAKLSRDFPELQNRILILMSRDFSRQQLIAKGTDATQRTAIFLFDIEARLRRHRCDSFEFVLPMSHEDIANHLGFTTETLSRVISKLQQSAVIRAERRRIRLLDAARLRLIAQGQTVNEAVTSH